MTAPIPKNALDLDLCFPDRFGRSGVAFARFATTPNPNPAAKPGAAPPRFLPACLTLTITADYGYFFVSDPPEFPVNIEVSKEGYSPVQFTYDGKTTPGKAAIILRPKK